MWAIIAILMVPTGIAIHKARIFERIDRAMAGKPEWMVNVAKRLAAIGILFLFLVLFAVAVEASGYAK